MNVTPVFPDSYHGDFNVQPGLRATGPQDAATPAGLETSVPFAVQQPGGASAGTFRTAQAQRAPWGLCARLRHREPLSPGNSQGPPHIPAPRHELGANLADFLGEQCGCGGTLLHSRHLSLALGRLCVLRTAGATALRQPSSPHSGCEFVSFLGVVWGWSSESPPPSYRSGNSAENASYSESKCSRSRKSPWGNSFIMGQKWKCSLFIFKEFSKTPLEFPIAAIRLKHTHTHTHTLGGCRPPKTVLAEIWKHEFPPLCPGSVSLGWRAGRPASFLPLIRAALSIKHSGWGPWYVQGTTKMFFWGTTRAFEFL